MARSKEKKKREVGTVLPKRNVKDSVFTDLFGNIKYLYQIYQALHPEDTETQPEDLRIITLENVIVNDIYNDLGFIVGERLICLIEAQATWTMNILVRVLLYYAKTLKEYLEEGQVDLYSTVKAVIPKPEFYVVYVGERGDKPEEIRLSEEFFPGEEIDLDITVKMLYGDTDDIIGEYVAFTKIYTEQYQKYGRTEKAIREAIRICKDKNVLREYLESREKEVVNIMNLLFDEEYIMAAHDKTVRQAGYNQGIDKERQDLIRKMLERNFTDKEILDWGYTEEEIERAKK